MSRLRRWWPIAVLCLTSLSSAPLAAQPSPTEIVGRIRSTGNRPIDFHAAAFPDSVYVGQQVTYQVAVLLSDQARARLRRNPEFLPPELRGLLAYELGTPARVASRTYGGGVAYEAHVFQRALFGVTAGSVRVPSPQLTYSLPQSSSYFSREDRFVVSAESAQLVIKPLPTEGRPADFTGAVGVLRASARVDAATARVGDPLVLTVRIEGTGNVRLLPRPTVEVSWASLVPGTERIRVDTSGALVRGSKEFDFLLTPTRDGAVTLPVVRYPYFDPYRQQYLVAETRPADLRVAAGALAASVAAEENGESLPLRPWRHRSVRTLGDLSPALRLSLLLLLLLLPAPALGLVVQRIRRQRAALGRATVPLTPREPAPDDDSPGGVARRTRRTLLASLAARLHVGPTELVTRADLERVLRRRGVTRQTTRDLVAFLDDLAVRGFGGGIADATVDDVERRARTLLDRVNAEAVSHGRTRLWRRGGRAVGATLLLLSASAAVAIAPRALRAQDMGPSTTQGEAHAGGEPFACRSGAGTTDAAAALTPLDLLVGEGVAAYNARRYAAAAQRFAGAVEACPRDVDLLVNWGTAAWAASDTVSAVIAWQRAARLDPLAADVQGRLALLPAGARGGLADVPLVPTSMLAIGAVVAWAVAWGLLWLSWRMPAGSRPLQVPGVLLACAALVAAGAAWWGHRALDATGLAVVRRPETLRAAPGFEAATVGGVSTGDIVRLSTAQEGWFRVRLADEREGWVPASRLTPLLGSTGIR